jgi:hypothetical protein
VRDLLTRIQRQGRTCIAIAADHSVHEIGPLLDSLNMVTAEDIVFQWDMPA